MKEYYLDRLNWIFTYRNKGFAYCLLKTLCLIIGVPLYAVLFVVEMAVTLLYALFSVIPLLNVIFLFISKCIMFVCNLGFYLNILTDIKEYKQTHNKDSLGKETAISEEDGECDSAVEQTEKAEPFCEKTKKADTENNEEK